MVQDEVDRFDVEDCLAQIPLAHILGHEFQRPLHLRIEGVLRHFRSGAIVGVIKVPDLLGIIHHGGEEASEVIDRLPDEAVAPPLNLSGDDRGGI